MANKFVKSFNFGGEDNYFPLPIVTGKQNGMVLKVVDGEWRVKDIAYVYVAPGLYATDSTFTPWEDLVAEGNITLSDSAISINTCDQSLVGKLVIPDTIMDINTNAFNGCSGLTSIIIPNSVTTISMQVFYECSGLTSMDLPDNLISINSMLFYNCSSLSSISIPNEVKTIWDWAFCNCTSLTFIVIPNSVTSVKEGAFWGCDALTDVYYMGSENEWSSIRFDSDNECLTGATIHYNYVT